MDPNNQNLIFFVAKFQGTFKTFTQVVVLILKKLGLLSDVKECDEKLKFLLTISDMLMAKFLLREIGILTFMAMLIIERGGRWGCGS